MLNLLSSLNDKQFNGLVLLVGFSLFVVLGLGFNYLANKVENWLKK